MEEHRVEASPQVLARIGGVLYLIIIVLGLFGEAFVRERIIVSGDATATAANIRSLESLWISQRSRPSQEAKGRVMPRSGSARVTNAKDRQTP